MDKTKGFLAENPHYFALVFAFFGILLLLACIFDSDFVFGNPISGDYNLKKIDGLVNFFGRKTARIIVGLGAVFLTSVSLYWFFLAATK